MFEICFASMSSWFAAASAANRKQEVLLRPRGGRVDESNCVIYAVRKDPELPDNQETHTRTDKHQLFFGHNVQLHRLKM